jgi:hypothetical protein
VLSSTRHESREVPIPARNLMALPVRGIFVDARFKSRLSGRGTVVSQKIGVCRDACLMAVVAATGDALTVAWDTGTKVLTIHSVPFPTYLGLPYLPWSERQCTNDTLLLYSTSILSQKSAAKTRTGTRSEWRMPDRCVLLNPLDQSDANSEISIVRTYMYTGDGGWYSCCILC